jgi:hypothetical protein
MPVALGVNGGVLGSNNLPSSGSAKGIWTPNEIARAVALGFWPVNYARSITETATGADVISTGANADPYFNLTTLLLSTTATNGQQNNTFQDSSTNNFTITRNPATGPNAPTQGTFSPFSQTGWGGAFNTSTTYLTVTDTANLRFGSGNFTIEAWVYRTASGATQTIASKGASTPTGWVFQISSADKLVFTDTSTSITGATSIAANTWTYVAVVRAGTGSNQTTLYVNGTSDGTGTSATTFNQTNNMLIGADRSTTNFANGYISNLRLSNTNRTISSTPTTALTADANTIFLSLNINRYQYTDSTAAFTNISVTGTPSVVPFSPFNPTSAWSASTVGGSGYFDGNADYLSNTSNTIIPNTGDFTFETWLYPTQVTTLQYLIATTNNSGNKFHLYINASAYVGVQTAAAYRDSSTTTVKANAWNHIACTRTGSTYALYVNGVSQSISGTGTMASTLDVTPTYIAARDAGISPITGYLSGTRVSNSVVYTGTFTLPTAPFTTGTNLLLNFTNAGIYDATAKNVLETVGNAQVSTTQSKWSPTSMYFDGTGDYLQSPDSELVEFGSGNFTIETWVRFAALPSSGNYYALLSKWDNSTQKSYLWYVYNNSGTYQLYFTYTTNGSTNINPVATITPSINTWYHYAVSRSGVNLRMFIDGTQVGSTYNIATDTIFGGTYPLQVGASTGANTLNGYMQDVRVTKGYARYTGNFTPPTAAFPVQ